MCIYLLMLSINLFPLPPTYHVNTHGSFTLDWIVFIVFEQTEFNVKRLSHESAMYLDRKREREIQGALTMYIMNTHCIIIHNHKLHLVFYFTVSDKSLTLIHCDRYEANSYFIQEIVSYTSIVLHNIYYYFEFSLFSFLFICYLSRDVSSQFLNVTVSIG